MDIVVLGSGPSENIPRQGSDLPVDVDARKPGSKSRRTQSSILVKSGNLHVLVDVTKNLLEQVEAQEVSKIDAVLITHGHSDATGGLAQLKEFMDAHKIENMPVYLSNKALENIKEDFKELDHLDFQIVSPYTTFKLGALDIMPIPVKHSVMQPGFDPTFAYRFDEDSESFLYMEDVDSVPEESVEKMKGVGLALIDAASYLGENIEGHLNAAETIELAMKLGVQKLYLAQIGHTYPPHHEAKRAILDYFTEKYPESDMRVDLLFDGLKVSSKDLEYEALIRNVDTYDPTKLPDKILVDDHYVSHLWASAILSGKRFKYSYTVVKQLHDSIVKEMLKRGFEHHTPLPEKAPESNAQPSQEEETEQTRSIRDIRHEDIKNMGDNQLMFWINVLPQLYHMPPDQKRKRKFTVEDVVNLYIMITQELKDRGKQFDIPDAELDEAAKRLKDKVPEHSSADDSPLQGHPYPLELKRCFDAFKDFEIENFVLIVGGLAERGESDNDVDLLIRQNFRDERMEEAILAMLPREIASRVQFIYARSGPHDKYVRLYKLKLEKVTNFDIKEISLDDQLD